MMKIPLFKPVIREEAIEEAANVLRSGWLGLGPKTVEFEEKFAQYLNVPFCVGLNSCTSALHLGLKLLNMPAGAEVITTAVSFIATNHVIHYEKCKPVFADIQPDTGNLDVKAVAKRISERTKAIILMHYGGYPCDLDEFYALSRDYNIPIVEDCAHACGAVYKGIKIGSYGDIHAFSFQAVKNLPMGDGGALTVRSADHHKRLRKLRWLGIDKDTYSRDQNNSYKWQYDVTEVGYKYHMNDIEAAIGLVQLQFLDADNARRLQVAQLYREGLADVPGIKLLCYDKNRMSSNHLFCILAENRNNLIEKLNQKGIDVSVHYQRNDSFPMYEKHDLPNTEYFCNHVLSLPMHLKLTDQEIEYIINQIRKGW